MAPIDTITNRNLKQMQQLIQQIRGDVEGAANRAADMDDFLNKAGIQLNTNIFTSDKYMDDTLNVVRSITEAFDITRMPIGGMREVYRETAQQHTMDYVTRMGDDLKQNLRDILKDNLEQGKGMRDTAADMMREIDLTRSRAESIARTETVRAKNLGDYYAANEKGYQYFVVSSAPDCCEECAEAYPGVVFTMDDTDMLPPLHPNCRCSANFLRTEDLAGDMASYIDNSWSERREALNLT